MSDEDNSKNPKFVIPESSEGKPINKLLVPKGDKNSDEESSKPKLATSDSSTSSDEDEKVKKILIPNQESIGDSESTPESTPEPNNSQEINQTDEVVKVVAMSPPSNDESSGELPNSSEDNWMKEAYNQVEIADKANEEIQNAQQEHLEHHSAEVVTNENVDYVQNQVVEQNPVEIPQLQVPQVQNITPAPTNFESNQYNQAYPQHPYPPMQQQIYHQQPNYGYGDFQNPMMNPQQQMIHVPTKTGLPVGLWFFMGLMTGLIIAIAGLKLVPQSFAEAIRPDLVERGKELVIKTINGEPQENTKETSE